MEGDILWAIKSREIFLLNYGRGHSKRPVKGFVLLELEGMSVAAYLCYLDWFVYALQFPSSMLFYVEFFILCISGFAISKLHGNILVHDQHIFSCFL